MIIIFQDWGKCADLPNPAVMRFVRQMAFVREWHHITNAENTTGFGSPKCGRKQLGLPEFQLALTCRTSELEFFIKFPRGLEIENLANFYPAKTLTYVKFPPLRMLVYFKYLCGLGLTATTLYLFIKKKQ
jgi:hypothetical protein